MESIQKDLLGIQERFEETRRKKREADMKAREEAERAKVIQLPIWAENVRGVPNSTLRCSLFAAIQSRYAKYLSDKVLVDSDKLKVTYKGEQLTQFDLDIWEYALHISRKQCLGHKIYTSERAFLKGIGRHTGKSQHQQLNRCFDRLIACRLHIIMENGDEYKGSFIQEWAKEESTGRMFLEINPRIARLFDAGHTYIQWEERQKIGSKPLCLWLHGYLATHAKWYPHKLETLQRLSGSGTKELWKFKQNLEVALKHLKEKELIEDFSIDGNLVHIKNKPSKSQQKHISNQ